MQENDLLPLISILIVNYNGRGHLKECLPSLEKLNYPEDKFEIILVDNGSTDGSIEYVKEHFPNVRIIKLDRNYGFCKPNNEGAKIAKGEYLVFLNNDTVVDRDWLSELVKATGLDEKIGSCACKMLYYDRRNIVNTAGGKLIVIGGGFYIGYGDEDGPIYNKSKFVGFGCGAGVLVKKELFMDVGGFDEEYFASVEEHDLGWKIWLRGYKVLYVPTAIIYHKESGTYGKKCSFQPIKVYYITRNRLYTLFKNLEAHNVVKGFFVTILFDSYRFLKYITSGYFASARALLKAYSDFLHNRSKIIKKRSIVQGSRLRNDHELYNLGVIATLKECVKEELRLSKILRDKFYNI